MSVDRQSRPVDTVLFSLYREIVLGGHLLALGTSSIAFSSAILSGWIPSADLLLMAYLFSFGAYAINRNAEIDQDALSNPHRTEYLRRRRKYLPTIVVASFIVGYTLAFMRNLTFFLALLVPLLLSLLYSIGSRKLTPLIGAKRLKERLFVKNLTISFGWSLIPLLVGLYYESLTLGLFLFGFLIFLRLMVNTIFFDVRDVRGDSANGIRTIPTIYGIKRSFAVMSFVDIISAFYIVLLTTFNLMPIYIVIMLVLPLYSAFYRSLAGRPNANINTLCDTVSDGEYIMWGPLIYLGRIIF